MRDSGRMRGPRLTNAWPTPCGTHQSRRRALSRVALRQARCHMHKTLHDGTRFHDDRHWGRGSPETGLFGSRPRLGAVLTQGIGLPKILKYTRQRFTRNWTCKNLEPWYNGPEPAGKERRWGVEGVLDPSPTWQTAFARSGISITPAIPITLTGHPDEMEPNAPLWVAPKRGTNRTTLFFLD